MAFNMADSVSFQYFHAVSGCRFNLPTAAYQCCYGNNSDVRRVNSMLSSYLIIARSILFRATPLVKSPSELGVGSDSCLPQTHDLWGGVRSSDVACRSHTPFAPGSLSTAEGRMVHFTL